MNYEDTEEFRIILEKYEEAKRQGRQLYLDSDDFADISEHYLRNDEVYATLEAINDGLTIHKDDPILLSLKVNALICIHKFQEAIDLISQLDEKEDHDVYYYRGQMACGVDHDYAKANRWFVKWYKREKAECDEMKNREEGEQRLRETFLHIILSIQDLGPEEEKQKTMTDWIDKYIEVCKPFAGDDIDREIARACHEVGLFDLEIQLYTYFLDINPYMPMGWTYLASMQNLNGDMDGAIESADFALAIDPEDTQALLVRGQSFFEKENYEQAMKSLSKYMELTDDPCFYALVGHCQILLGQKDKGYEMLKKAQNYITKGIKDKARQKEGRKYLISCYFDGGFYTEARRLANLLLKADPDDINLLCFRGRLNLKTGRYDDAIFDFEWAEWFAYDKVSALMLAGGCLVESLYYEKALEYFSKAVEMKDNPNHIKAWVYMAQMHYMLYNRKEFFKCLKQACDLTPELVRQTWTNELMGVNEKEYFIALCQAFRNF